VSQIQKLSYHPDAIDWQIVDALKDFGRRTNTELASELGINETTVRKRIARLLREGLMNVVAVPNPLKMGYTVVALIGVTAAANQIEQVERAVLKIPSVRYAAMTTGSFDFMLEAWFVSSDDLRLFLVEELGKIPGVVRSETFHVLKLIKHLSDWGLPDQVSSQRPAGRTRTATTPEGQERSTSAARARAGGSNPQARVARRGSSPNGRG